MTPRELVILALSGSVMLLFCSFPVGPTFFLPLLQERLDLLHLLSIPLDLLRVFRGRRAVLLVPITLPMLRHDALGDSLELLALLVQLAMRGAPLLRRIGGQLAPVDGEVLLPDQPDSEA